MELAACCAFAVVGWGVACGCVDARVQHTTSLPWNQTASWFVDPTVMSFVYLIPGILACLRSRHSGSGDGLGHSPL